MFSNVPSARRRSVSLAALSVVMLLSVSPIRAAGGPASVWDIVLDGGQRQCRLTLRGDNGGKGAPVAMPPGCHRAIPALSGVVFWSDNGDGKLQLNDVKGEPILIFTADGKDYTTTSPQGELYRLVPANAASSANLAKSAASASAKVETAQAVRTPAPSKKPAAASQKPEEVAGRYAVLRDKTHDTGCMVTLDDKSHGPDNTLKARLAPACRDQGIVIFDPVGWQMMSGQLVLTARKGHKTELDTQEDGSWMNNPKTGKTLSLKRI